MAYQKNTLDRGPKQVTKDDSLYFVDNGAVYCGLHLGMTARFTGRDISGQRIEEITPSVFAECNAIGFLPRCENCGKEPAVIDVTPARQIVQKARTA